MFILMKMAKNGSFEEFVIWIVTLICLIFVTSFRGIL